MNVLDIPDIPAGVARSCLFLVDVRTKTSPEWHSVPLYEAWVDMHDVRACAVGLFDFTEPVEVRVRPPISWIYSAVIRPMSLQIQAETDGRKVRFTLEAPADLMLEINGERFHCLHLLTGTVQREPPQPAIRLMPEASRPRTVEVRSLLPRLTAMPEGRTLVFGPGLHVVDEYVFHVPSDTRIYLAPGAVVIGAFVVENAQNVIIEGHGVILQRAFHRFSSINGVRISHSRNVRIEEITFLNPPHYTIHLGGSENVTIRNIRAFSCEGWSDGVDIMSCQNVRVDHCFLRTSDDCIAIYGSRWEYHGDTRDVLVEHCALWADVAHPTLIGTHGDAGHGGDIIEHVTFRHLDLLEHHEFQPGYLGCLAINAGDQNTVRDILYEHIRVEHMEHGRLLDVQVKMNRDYNLVSGKRIERVTFHDIACDCVPAETSVIRGYDADHDVRDIRLQQVTVCGQPAAVIVGPFASDVVREED